MQCYVYKEKRKRDGKRQVARCYRGRYSLDGGRTVRSVALGTTDKQVAERKLAALVKELQREAVGLEAPARLRQAQAAPLGEHIADFVANLESLGRSAMRVTNVRGFLQTVAADCGWRTVADVTADGFETWRRRHAEKSAKTLNEYLLGWQCFLNWMERSGRMAGRPLAAVAKVDGRGKERVQRRALSQEEAARLLAAAGPRMPLYLAAMMTGLRRGELAALTWADVALDGPGVPALRVRASTAKNRQDVTLGLAPDLVEVLRHERGAEWSPDAPVFYRLRRMGEFRADLAAAGIPYLVNGRRLDFHALRKTCATWMMAAGVPLRVAMEHMRHSDARLTAKVYTDVCGLPVSEAANRMPRLVEKAAHIAAHKIGARGQEATQVDSGPTGAVVSQGVAAEADSHEVSRPDAAGGWWALLGSNQ